MQMIHQVNTRDTLVTRESSFNDLVEEVNKSLAHA